MGNKTNMRYWDTLQHGRTLKYVQWKKPVTRSQQSIWFPFYEMFRTGESTETKLVAKEKKGIGHCSWYRVCSFWWWKQSTVNDGAAQLCEYTKGHRSVHVKWVNCSGWNSIFIQLRTPKFTLAAACRTERERQGRGTSEDARQGVGFKGADQRGPGEEFPPGRGLRQLSQEGEWKTEMRYICKYYEAAKTYL